MVHVYKCAVSDHINLSDVQMMHVTVVVLYLQANNIFVS